MMAKTQNLKPDTVLKNYWSHNGQFADLFNAVLFGGKQVIKPGELESEDTEGWSTEAMRRVSRHPGIISRSARDPQLMGYPL